MLIDVAIITNTHSINSDLWECHFGQLQKYIPKLSYAFSNVKIPDEKVSTFIYNDEDKFRTQYMSGLRTIKEKYCLYLNEDYLLYEEPNISKLEEYISILEKVPDLSFIRLAKGIDNFHIPLTSTLNYLDCRNPYFFSQTASLWNTSHLLAIHERGPDLHIAGEDMSQQFEVAATDVCRSLGIQGSYHYAGEQKRGEHHYDSNVFPYVASALVKGKWNIKEYEGELSYLQQMYDLDFSQRGVYE